MDEEKYKILEKRIEQLEMEVQQLKRERGQQPVVTDKKQIPISQTKPLPSAEKIPIDWEKRVGQVWLPRTFLFVFLIGLIWGFKAATDIGLLNEIGRVIIGYAIGIGAIFIGFKQMQKKRSGLGQVLLGGAIVVLILSTFAGNVLYGFIPSVIALLLNLTWAIVGIYLSYRFSSQPISILAAVAGFLAPFLIESNTGNVYFFLSMNVVFICYYLRFLLNSDSFIYTQVQFSSFI